VLHIYIYIYDISRLRVKHPYSGNCEKHIDSACEQKTSLVVQEKVYTDDIVLLWVKMATLSGNVPNNK